MLCAVQLSGTLGLKGPSAQGPHDQAAGTAVS